MAMSLFQNDFQKHWENLSGDVNRLNEYTTTHSVELRKVKVEDKDLAGAIFSGATFIGVDWERTILEETTFKKTIFKDCKFLGSLHWNSHFDEVTFDNCTFHDAEFGHSTFTNVKFKNCKIIDTRLEDLKGNELVIEESDLEERTSLAGSSIPMTFFKSSLDGVILSGMKMPGKMSLEDCVLSEVDFSNSKFSSVVLKKTTQGEGGVRFNSVTAKSISFEDVEMLRGVGMGWANVALVRIVGGKLYGPAFKKANIAKTVIRDAYVTRFAIGNMDTVQVANSTLHRSGLFEGGIQEFSVVNSTIDEIVGKNFKANIVLWDNVTLDGKIDLTGAQVKDFRATRLKRGPNLQLITTGSNIKLP